MTSKIAIGLSAVLVVALPSCRPHENTPSVTGEGESVASLDVTVTNLRQRPSKLFCDCNNIPGHDLVFDLTVTNRGEQRRTVYALLWFAANDTSPPERAVWPQAAAEACVMRDGELTVADHRTGARFEVPGRDSFTQPAGTILQPIGYYQGRLVSFDTLRVELWTEAGDRILEKALELKPPFDRDPQEPSPPPGGKEEP